MAEHVTEEQHADERAGHDDEHAAEGTTAVAGFVGLRVGGRPEPAAGQEGDQTGENRGRDADENQVEHGSTPVQVACIEGKL